MIPALIAVALLLLGPGLACGRSSAGTICQSSNSLRASVRAARSGLVRLSQMPVSVEAAQPSAPSDPAGYNPDSKRWRGWAELKAPGRSMLQHAGPAGRSLPGHRLIAVPFGSVAFPASALSRPPGSAGLQPNVLKAVQPWLRGGYLDGSGHGDPADNKHGTFSTAVHPLLSSSPESDFLNLQSTGQPGAASGSLSARCFDLDLAGASAGPLRRAGGVNVQT